MQRSKIETTGVRIYRINGKVKRHKDERTNYRILAIADSTDRYDPLIAYHTEQIRLLKKEKLELLTNCNSTGRCCGQKCRCRDCVECGGEWYDDGKFE